jgi:hypothetical protein
MEDMMGSKCSMNGEWEADRNTRREASREGAQANNISLGGTRSNLWKDTDYP